MAEETTTVENFTIKRLNSFKEKKKKKNPKSLDSLISFHSKSFRVSSSRPNQRH